MTDYDGKEENNQQRRHKGRRLYRRLLGPSTGESDGEEKTDVLSEDRSVHLISQREKSESRWARMNSRKSSGKSSELCAAETCPGIVRTGGSKKCNESRTGTKCDERELQRTKQGKAGEQPQNCQNTDPMKRNSGNYQLRFACECPNIEGNHQKDSDHLRRKGVRHSTWTGRLTHVEEEPSAVTVEAQDRREAQADKSSFSLTPRKPRRSVTWASRFFTRSSTVEGSHPMGGALRKQCCGGRDDEDVKVKAKEKMGEKSLAFLGGEGGVNDLSLFDEAHQKNDVKALVNLLDSEQPFARSDSAIHPWASQPRSVGALAAMQLASLASKEATAGDQPIKNAIREAGGIPKLVKFLSSKEEDRKHAAVVALSFLALENAKNCNAMYEAGAVPPLIECMKVPPEGMKAAAADALRSVYVLDVSYREAFVKAGGIAPLVALLELPKGEYDPNSLFNQSEAVFHIDDLIMESGSELPKFVKAVKDSGAKKKLELLSEVDGAIKEDAKSVLIRLAD